MIIIGYQGVGKSTLAEGTDWFPESELGNGIIDLESSSFWVNGKRDENWYKIYANIAHHLSQQGHIVFTASHGAVREELKKYEDEDYIRCLYPSLELKDEWVEKLEKRYNETGLDKDFKAWKNAEQCYEENIKDMMNSGFKDPIEITSMDYDLGLMIFTANPA